MPDMFGRAFFQRLDDIAEMTRYQCDTIKDANHHDFQDLEVEITIQPRRLNKFDWPEDLFNFCSIFNPEFETPNTVISGTFLLDSAIARS